MVIVTIQLINFGDMRMGHVNFIEESKTSLRHIFLPEWSSERDVIAYPPNDGPYAVYSFEQFYRHITYAVVQYYTLNSSTFGNYEYNHKGTSADNYPPLIFCIYQYRSNDANPADTDYVFDTTILKNCTYIDLENQEWLKPKFSVLPILAKRNFTINRRRFLYAELSFSLKTVHIRRSSGSDLPDCFQLDPVIEFKDPLHTGQVVVQLSATAEYLNCKGEMKLAGEGRVYRISMTVLDIIILPVCFVSFILCVRALLSAYFLKTDTRKYLKEHYGWRMTLGDELAFLNGWYILILLNDAFILLGTVLKLNLEFKVFDSSLLTATGMLLGVGTLMVWFGVLRYFCFFPQYNVIILTLKHSIPNVMRFMLCAAILYFGFLFCGWIVIGPYNMKFRSLMTSSECLFALINGDDMFATYSITSQQNTAVLWFTRIYLYVFTSLFIYVVLSLFTSIIINAYEVIRDHGDHDRHSQLFQFINEDKTPCESANFPVRGSAVFLRCCQSIRTQLLGSSRVPRYDGSSTATNDDGL